MIIFRRQQLLFCRRSTTVATLLVPLLLASDFDGDGCLGGLAAASAFVATTNEREVHLDGQICTDGGEVGTHRRCPQLVEQMKRETDSGAKNLVQARDSERTRRSQGWADSRSDDLLGNASREVRDYAGPQKQSAAAFCAVVGSALVFRPPSVLPHGPLGESLYLVPVEGRCCQKGPALDRLAGPSGNR